MWCPCTWEMSCELSSAPIWLPCTSTWNTCPALHKHFFVAYKCVFMCSTGCIQSHSLSLMINWREMVLIFYVICCKWLIDVTVCWTIYSALRVLLCLHSIWTGMLDSCSLPCQFYTQFLWSYLLSAAVSCQLKCYGCSFEPSSVYSLTRPLSLILPPLRCYHNYVRFFSPPIIM